MVANLTEFYIPTRMKIGAGLSEQTGELLNEYGLKKLLIVTDQGVINAHLMDGIEKSLKESNIDYLVFDEVEPNPSSEIALKGVQFLKQNECDGLLAIGGGSSIDTSKGIAVLATNEGDILDYEGFGKIKNPSLPLIVIPTTAGTGSEATPSTVFTNKKTSFKTAILSPHLYPKLAILDPLLTVKLPPSITAATGMDALTHAIESYISKFANPVSQALGIHAIKLIGENLSNAYFVGTNLKAREEMLVASMIAGIAFAHAKLGNVHAISHTFSGIFNIPHGIANAALLPFVMKYNLPAAPERMKEIAIALGKDVTGLSTLVAGEKAIEAVMEMNKAFDIPNNIKDLGVTLDLLPKMVEDSMRSGNVLANPRLTKAADIKQIIENAYYGI